MRDNRRGSESQQNPPRRVSRERPFREIALHDIDRVSGYDHTVAASFDFHNSMLADDQRTQSFLRAILATVRPGDVVVDIGTGTGVLSLFAVMAGARMVYAIEQEPIVEVAREVARANGLDDKIRFISGPSRGIELPEVADVLLTETIGNVGFDEGVVAWAADADRRFLRQGARCVPRQVSLHAALVEAPYEYAQIDRWSRPLATLDFSPFRRVGSNNIHWTDLSPVSLISDSAELFGRRLPCREEALEGGARLAVTRDADVHGLGVWFTAELAPGIRISNQPPGDVPSWEQGFFPIDRPLRLSKGESTEVMVRVTRGGADWVWTVGSCEMSTTLGRLGAPKREAVKPIDERHGSHAATR
jgi:predicted RNA methylase